MGIPLFNDSGFGIDDIVGGALTGGVYNAGKWASGGYRGEGEGSPVEDFFNVGQNGFRMQPYATPDINFGRDPNGANYFSGLALNGMKGSNSLGSLFAQGSTGLGAPVAREDQFLSNQEASARGWDQAGSMDLAREAAMGQSPSEAAWLMQHGLDQAIAGQSSAAGSARGSNALALAQGNAGANIANLQQQAFTGAMAGRANEMNQNRNLYANQANAMRQQDQNRLGMGNDISKFNANLQSQFMQGMGGLAVQNQAAGQGWMGQAMQPWQNQLDADVRVEAMRGDNYNRAGELNAGIVQGNADRQSGNRDMIVGTIIGGLNTGINAGRAGSSGGGMKNS